MQLYTLFHGTAKSRMYPIMTDSLKKCQNYLKERAHTVKGFHKIEPAVKDATVWRRKSTTIGGNKDLVPRINKQGKTSHNGWIGKNGFNQHT